MVKSFIFKYKIYINVKINFRYVMVVIYKLLLKIKNHFKIFIIIDKLIKLFIK